jgi:hypothetical protein
MQNTDSGFSFFYMGNPIGSRFEQIVRKNSKRKFHTRFVVFHLPEFIGSACIRVYGPQLAEIFYLVDKSTNFTVAQRRWSMDDTSQTPHSREDWNQLGL